MQLNNCFESLHNCFIFALLQGLIHYPYASCMLNTVLLSAQILNWNLNVKNKTLVSCSAKISPGTAPYELTYLFSISHLSSSFSLFFFHLYCVKGLFWKYWIYLQQVQLLPFAKLISWNMFIVSRFGFTSFHWEGGTTHSGGLFWSVTYWWVVELVLKFLLSKHFVIFKFWCAGLSH